MTTPRITETRRHGQPPLAERLARSDIGFTGAFELPVREGERALEVFHHPYAYAARPQHRRVPIAVSHSS